MLHRCRSIVAGNDVEFWLYFRVNQIGIIRVHEETRGIRRSCFSHALTLCGVGFLAQHGWLWGQIHPQKKDIRQIPQQIKIEHLFKAAAGLRQLVLIRSLCPWLWTLFPDLYFTEDFQTPCCGFYLYSLIMEMGEIIIFCVILLVVYLLMLIIH